jgi:hypothetical protein
MNPLVIIKLITSALMALPTIDKAVRAIIAAIGEAIKEYDDKKSQQLGDLAKEKLKEGGDTSALEQLMNGDKK